MIIFRFCLTRSIKDSRAAVQHCWLKLMHLKCNKNNSSLYVQHGVLQQQKSQRWRHYEYWKKWKSEKRGEKVGGEGGGVSGEDEWKKQREKRARNEELMRDNERRKEMSRREKMDSGLVFFVSTYTCILYKPPFRLVRGCTHSFINAVTLSQIVITQRCILALNCFIFSNNFHANTMFVMYRNNARIYQAHLDIESFH